MDEQLILVNEKDEEIGFGEKMLVHQQAQLHRAFSIFVLNDRDELLLQRRAFEKYHSGGLWANTCCSHPVRGEQQEDRVHRRLREEMGFDCELKPLFHFIYRVELDNGLTEYEYDHVYLGRYNGDPSPDPEEVCEWKRMQIADVVEDIRTNPEQYTYWVKQAIDQFYREYKR